MTQGVIPSRRQLDGVMRYCRVQRDELFSRLEAVISRKTKSASRVISALAARSRLGQILEEVDKGHRSFVIEKRGSPKAILLGIQDYIRLAAPEPEVLKNLGEESARRGTDKLTAAKVDSVIKAARASRRGAVS
jgi:prevent-host-death family protein